MVSVPSTFTRACSRTVSSSSRRRSTTRYAALVTAQLLFLQSEDPERDIFMYINSPGGVVYSGLAIYDTMQHIAPDVSTMCMGFCGSMATVLLAGGAAGKRYALPNATVHMHPAGMQNLGGYAPDVEIHARELLAPARAQL